MFKNYVKVTLRNAWKHKGFSFLNIAGLGMGMAACVLILLYVKHELSYDSAHERADDVYRVILDAAIMDQEITSTTTPAPMAAVLTEEFPEVVAAVRIQRALRALISAEERRFSEDRFFWADSTVFDVFTIPLLQGDARTALTRPNTVVLTEEMARKYFGGEEAVGRRIRLNDGEDYEVTGVVREATSPSHFEFDFIASFVSLSSANDVNWLNNSYQTYVLVQPGLEAAVLESKFPDLVRKYVAPQMEQALGQSYAQAEAAGMRWGFHLENLRDIYLQSKAQDQIGATGDIRYVYTLSAIAVFILVIAGINFVNLTTARATNRAREVGMRKVMGSERGPLIRQFLGESVILAFVAQFLTVGLVFAALPLFNNVTGKALWPGLDVVFIVLGIALAFGLLAGIYPAFVLSSFQPIDVLKGTMKSGARGSSLRRVLVVAQFAISMALIIGTAVVFKQLRYVQNAELGFAKEQVVVLPIETDRARQGVETFRNEIVQHAGIVSAASSNGLPGHIHNNTGFRKEGARDEEVFVAARIGVSHDYVETLGLEIAAGRDLSRDFATDKDAYLVNESAARSMGWTPEQAVGKLLDNVGGGPDGGDRTGPIVGVVKDFHFESLHEPIRNLVLAASESAGMYVSVRISPDQVKPAISFLEEQWATYEPANPFEYFFLDEDFGRFYEQERRLGRIFTGFTILAIFIACLGLFGLASYVTSRRTKEIGVRKVLGASVGSILVLLSKEFTRLVLISALIAFPIAYLMMDQWLEEFAYKTTLSWWIFAAAAVLSLVIAWSTVAYQALRAATANPVDSLRFE